MSQQAESRIPKLLEEWAGEFVVLRHDAGSGSWIIIAVHSTRLGAAIGGTRMGAYPNLCDGIKDAQRLAVGMTHKWSSLGIAAGGGKSVIVTPPDLSAESRTGLLKRYGQLLAQLKGVFSTGPDMGTSSEDMEIIAEFASSFVFCRPTGSGGAGDPAPFTAKGVLTSMEMAIKKLDGDACLKGKRVVIQGMGHVGSRLADGLLEAGAKVLFSDVSTTTIKKWRDQRGLEFVHPEQALETPCDIFSPCAGGGILNPESISKLQCRAVVGSANNQLAHSGDGILLRQKGILYAPDFIANSGGAISVIYIERQNHSVPEALQLVRQTVGGNLTAVFERAEQDSCSTHQAALSIAQERIGG